MCGDIFGVHGDIFVVHGDSCSCCLGVRTRENRGRGVGTKVNCPGTSAARLSAAAAVAGGSESEPNSGSAGTVAAAATAADASAAAGTVDASNGAGGAGDAGTAGARVLSATVATIDVEDRQWASELVDPTAGAASANFVGMVHCAVAAVDVEDSGQ